MTPDEAGPTSLDDPRRFYRTPLLLLGLTAALTSAVWWLAVRERVPDWQLHLDEFRGISELRSRLAISGDQEVGLEVHRIPAPTGVTVEVPEILAAMPGYWRFKIDLNRSGDDGVSGPVAVTLNGRPVLTVPADEDGRKIFLGREDIADGPNILHVDVPRPEGIKRLYLRNTPGATRSKVPKVLLFQGGRDSLARLGPPRWRFFVVGLVLMAAMPLGVWWLLGRRDELPVFTPGQAVHLLAAAAIALATICALNLVSPVILCIETWTFILLGTLYWLVAALTCLFRNVRVMRFEGLSPVQREGWNDLRHAIWIFVALLAVFMSTGRNMKGKDTIPPPLIAQSLIREGNFDLDEFDPIYHWGKDRWVLDTRHIGAKRPHVVSRWAPGNAVMALPFFAVPTLLGLEPASRSQDELSKLSAAFLTALSAAFVFLACRKVASTRGALLVTIGYALGTTTFVYSSQELWQHTAVQLCLAVALWCVLTADEHPGRHWLAAFSLGFSLFCREIDAVFAAAMLAYVGLRFGPKRWITYALGGLPGVVMLLGYNLYYFGQLTSAGYVGVPNGTFGGNPLVGFLGLWISPNRGLLIYSPFILFALYGAWVTARHENAHYRWLAWCLVPALLASFLIHGSLHVWHGTFGYSCRYGTDGLVFWSFMLAVVIDRVWARRASRAAFSLLLALSIFFHAIGAYEDPYQWNREAEQLYGTLDKACWSWSFWQIGYQIRKAFGS